MEQNRTDLSSPESESERDQVLSKQRRVTATELKGFGLSRERERERECPSLVQVFSKERIERVDWNRLKRQYSLHSALYVHRACAYCVV